MPRYFTPEEYKSELNLEQTAIVLERLASDEDISGNIELPIEFFFMSDSMDKMEEIEEKLEELGYDIDSIEKYDDGIELIGNTAPMKMTVETINEWKKQMWDLGFSFDCKLDGWHVLVD